MKNICYFLKSTSILTTISLFEWTCPPTKIKKSLSYVYEFIYNFFFFFFDFIQPWTHHTEKTYTIYLEKKKRRKENICSNVIFSLYSKSMITIVSGSRVSILSNTTMSEYLKLLLWLELNVWEQKKNKINHWIVNFQKKRYQ